MIFESSLILKKKKKNYSNDKRVITNISSVMKVEFYCR